MSLQPCTPPLDIRPLPPPFAPQRKKVRVIRRPIDSIPIRITQEGFCCRPAQVHIAPIPRRQQTSTILNDV